MHHLVVPAVVIDISDYVQDNPDRHLTLEQVLQWEKDHGPIPDGSLLLVRTGWARFWSDRIKYSGIDGRDEKKEKGGMVDLSDEPKDGTSGRLSDGTKDGMIDLSDSMKSTDATTKLRFPSIEKEVAEWLVEKRKVVGVGIDTMSVDVPNRRPSVHVTLMEKNIYGLENLENLHLLPATGTVVYVMPMKLRYASGAPCRVVAQVGDSENVGAYEHSLSWCVGSNNVIVLVTILMAFGIARM